VEELSASFGPKWYRTQLPEDVRQKFKDAVTVEKRYPWLQLVPHHPIYYTDFPDLKKIITRNDNWLTAFQTTFGRNKDVVLGMLAELEPLRNAIAHNRAISAPAVNLIEDARERLRTALGPRRFDQLAAGNTVAPDVRATLFSLRQEGNAASYRMGRCERGLVLEVWVQAKDQWWFDDNYLSTDLEPIRAFFHLAQDYNDLPRSMGDGYCIERWLAEQQFEPVSQSLDASWAFLTDSELRQ
jgi:hypothetical protein